MLNFMGIGLGPFNLSLAALLNDQKNLNYKFLDKRSSFDWHAGIQLPNAMMQVPFMADLVSLIDPTSPFGFLNYLKEHQRLYKFYFRENMYIPRKEYNHYCQWVAQQLHSLQFDHRVVDVAPISGGFQVISEHQGRLSIQQTQKLVLGLGTTPKLPKPLQTLSEETNQCFHSSRYLNQDLNENLSGNVVLIGSGQSAAEIFLDLFDRQISPVTGKPKFHLYWLTRSAGFFPMENSPLGLESFSPDYMNYFYNLPKELKNNLPDSQTNLYKGISHKTIRDIYEKLYHRSVGDAPTHVTICGNHQLESAEVIRENEIELTFLHTQKQKTVSLKANTVIGATGYQYPDLGFLSKIEHLIPLDEFLHYQISEHHKLNYKGDGEIYIQNTDLHHHGVGTPDLGLGALRSAKIANQILGQAYFEIDGQQSFQNYELWGGEQYVQSFASKIKKKLSAESISPSLVRAKTSNTSKYVTK